MPTPLTSPYRGPALATSPRPPSSAILVRSSDEELLVEVRSPTGWGPPVMILGMVGVLVADWHVRERGVLRNRCQVFLPSSLTGLVVRAPEPDDEDHHHFLAIGSDGDPILRGHPPAHLAWIRDVVVGWITDHGADRDPFGLGPLTVD